MSSSEEDVLAELVGHPVPSRDASDDEVDIPAIFKTSAVANERLLRQHDRIEQEILIDTLKARDDYSQLARMRDKIVKELNDNGAGIAISLEDAALRRVVELLVKQAFGKSLAVLKRHFYMYASHERGNSEAAQWGKKHIDEVLELSSEVAVKRAIPLDNDQSLEGDFLRRIGRLGGYVSLASSPTVPVKLRHVQHEPVLLLAKLTAVFLHHIRNGPSSSFPTLLRVFLLTILDYNLNRVLEIDVFVKEVFPRLVEWRQAHLSDELFVVEFNLILDQTCVPAYDDVDVVAAAQMKYNVLRLVAKTSRQVVFSLQLSFIQDHDFLSESHEKYGTTHDRALGLLKVATSFVSRLRKLDLDSPKVHLAYFKLLVFNSLLQNTLLDSDRHHKRLRKLLLGLATTRDRIHAHLGKVVMGSDDTMVQLITNIYEMLAYMYLWTVNDLKWTNSDTFYEQ